MQTRQGVDLQYEDTYNSNELVSDLLFPTVVWRKELNYNNTVLKEYVNDLMKASDGRKISNYGGWQSDPLIGNFPCKFKDLQLLIDKCITEISNSINFPTMKLDNLWFNVNTPGTYNIIHNHPGAIISGVYYIDVPEDNMGNIEFYRSDDSSYYLNGNSETFFGSDRFIYKSITGVLLLFPSWLKHSVQGNLSKQNRISMSFNYNLELDNEN